MVMMGTSVLDLVVALGVKGILNIDEYQQIETIMVLYLKQ